MAPRYVGLSSFRLSAYGTLLLLAACADTSEPNPAAPATLSQSLSATAAWSVVASPNRGTLANDLKGVAGISATDIWAVGEWNPGLPPTVTGRRTLALHWNGSAWKLVTTPNAAWSGVDLSTFEDVVTVSSTSAWAVGHANDFGSFKSTTLIARWNGSSWSLVPSPNPGGATQPNQLFGVAAVSGTDIWAVGSKGSPATSLIVHWNGSAWSNVPNSCGRDLYDVAAVSATNVWAVGEQTICHYNGATWTAMAPAETGISLFDIAAVSSTAIWAVGREYYCTYACNSFSHIEKYDGTRWTEVFHPQASTLYGVVAIAANDVWAVGNNSTVGKILHWDGASWSVSPSPTTGTASSLNMIARAGTRLWGVGDFYDANYTMRTWTVRR
jgi:hypothetical protein